MKDKPYVIILFMQQKYACYLDRGYNYMGDDPEVWKKVKIGDIVQVDHNAFYPQASDKAAKLAHKHQWVTLWTKYYD